MQSLSANTTPSETEVLSENDRLNEYIMTSLRTIWGLDLDKLNAIAAAASYPLLLAAATFVERDWIVQKGNLIYLTKAGKLYADHIASELFFD